MKRLIWVGVVVAVSIFFSGCGSGIANSASQASSASQVAGTSGSSGSSGSGSTGSSGSGSTGTSGSGSTGTSGSGSTGSGASSTVVGTSISGVQTTSGNWQSFGQLPPVDADCAAPCSGVSWNQTYGISSPSMSGNATEFRIAPNVPYADVLFTAGLIGVNSPQLPDGDHTLLPTLHNFIYDSYFYVADPSVTQALEFDVSVWMSGIAGMTFGHQCANLGDGDWDIWDNVDAKWVSAGVPCEFSQGWNHVTIEVQREADNSLLYQSIALNGTTYTLNKTYPSIPCPPGWWGVNVNYQLDSDAKGDANTTYLDNLTITYW